MLNTANFIDYMGYNISRCVGNKIIDRPIRDRPHSINKLSKCSPPPPREMKPILMQKKPTANIKEKN